MVTCSNMFQEE